MRKRYTFPALLMMVVIMLFVSACGGSNLTAGQVLSNASNTMKQIKAVHFDVNATLSYALTGVPGNNSTSSFPNNTNIKANLNGDEVLPDQSSLKLTATTPAQFTLAEIVKGNRVYLQNKHGQWYVFDKSKLGNSASNGSMPDFNKLFNLVQKDAKLTDHGDETLNGVSLRHITFTFDKNGLAQLIQNIAQLKSLPNSQQIINELLNSVSNFSASLDLWIDESTSYVHRFEMKLNITLNASQFVTPTPGSNSSTPPGATLKADIIVDLSRFNDSSIKITAPANAIPTDNPGIIFGA
jgi:hypothetical protein